MHENELTNFELIQSSSLSTYPSLVYYALGRNYFLVNSFSYISTDNSLRDSFNPSLSGHWLRSSVPLSSSKVNVKKLGIELN